MFAFRVEVELTNPVPMGEVSTSITVRFQHFDTGAVTMGSGDHPGAYNLGFRLYITGEMQPVLEGRAVLTKEQVGYGETIAGEIVIVREVIDFNKSYRLLIDVVKEHEYWFSDKDDTAHAEVLSFYDQFAESRVNITGGQIESLEILLARAFSRISELEYSEKILAGQRDDYRARFEGLGRHVDTVFKGLTTLPPPAERVNSILRSFDPVQRRDLWLTHLADLDIKGAAFALYPHDGQPGPLNILVHGTGGYGDMIYLSAVVRELYQLFSPCAIFVMHENPNLSHVFGANPYITGMLSLPSQKYYPFLEIAQSNDIFDLVADIRYAATYSTPPMSRVPVQFAQRALYSSAEYQKYVRYSWPQLNNIFANYVTSKGLHKLDVLGMTSLLPIDRTASYDLFVAEGDMMDVPELRGQAYITVHHGADQGMSAEGRTLQTKNLTASFWAEVVRGLKAEGYKIVQLGDKREEKVEGIDVDLRGASTLVQTASIIKMASAHVDTEGGLVHVARAVRNRSVVAFGPTSVEFFGYPENRNIPPAVCGNCWWTKATWSQFCPRELKVPECMHSHSPAVLIEAARELATARFHSTVTDVTVAQGGVDIVADPEIKQVLSEVPADGLIVIGPQCNLRDAAEFLISVRSPARILVETSAFRDADAQFGRLLRLAAYSLGNLPVRDRSCSMAVALNFDIRNEKGAAFCADFARTVGAGRVIMRATNRQEPLSMRTWVRHFGNAAALIKGVRLGLSVPDHMQFPQDQASALTLSFTADAPTPMPEPLVLEAETL